MKKFDEFINEGNDYKKSVSYDASFIIAEYIKDKINIKTSNMRYDDVFNYTVDNNIEYNRLNEYFGIKVWLNNIKDSNFKEYINVLTNIDIELDKFNPIESYLEGYELYVYFKLTDEIKKYVINVIDSEKGINKYKL